MYYEVLFLAVCAVSTSVSSRIDLENVEEKLRLLNPTFMMMEQLFSLQDENECIERTFCLLETEMTHVLNNPLKHYSRFLTNMFEEIEPLAFKKVKDLSAKYPHISRVTDGKSETCNKKFDSCKNEQNELVWFAKMMGDDVISKSLPNLLSKSKRDCKGNGLGCSLIGGGCALCTIATEGICGAICGPEVGATCAGISLGCLFG